MLVALFNKLSTKMSSFFLSWTGKELDIPLSHDLNDLKIIVYVIRSEYLDRIGLIKKGDY